MLQQLYLIISIISQNHKLINMQKFLKKMISYYLINQKANAQISPINPIKKISNICYYDSLE